MITVAEAKQLMIEDPRWWKIALMDFVDDFRRTKKRSAIETPFELGDEEKDAVFAGAIETLCDEMEIEIPLWLTQIPNPKRPVFLSRMEDLKAVAIVESPVRFRLRNVFVCDNFLFRV